MAGHRDLKTLKALVEVRKVQQLGAEMAVARADAALRALQDEQSRTVDRLGEMQNSWSQSLSKPLISLPLASAWSNQIVDGEAKLRGLGDDIKIAEHDRADRAMAWRMAQARAELAGDLAGRAQRQQSQRREETRLVELEDRFARRSGRA